MRAFFATVLLLLMSLQAAPSPAKRPPKTDTVFDTLFDAKQPDIRDCALKEGIYKGAKAVALTADILIGRDGRVFTANVMAEVDGGDKKAIEACVADALRTIVFPKGAGAFRKIVRNWHFAVA